MFIDIAVFSMMTTCQTVTYLVGGVVKAFPTKNKFCFPEIGYNGGAPRASVQLPMDCLGAQIREEIYKIGVA